MMAREPFLCKANSLDALCRRLAVFNPNRALKGSPLDAGLLSEVQTRILRGQNLLLVIDADEPMAIQTSLQAIDIAMPDLIVVDAD